jgi:hypothetical protein
MLGFLAVKAVKSSRGCQDLRIASSTGENLENEIVWILWGIVHEMLRYNFETRQVDLKT